MGFQQDQLTIDRRPLKHMHVVRRLGFVLSMCTLFGCVATAGSNERIEDSKMTPKVSLALVESIESALAMPLGAHPLTKYVRYYAQHTVNSHSYVVATFVRRESKGRIEIVDFNLLPQVFDGGCDVIKLRYSVTQEKVVSFLCNGDA